MVKVKITVIKTFSPEDVFGEKEKIPSDEITTPCPRVIEGQEFLVENLDKPEGFCGWAWRDVYKDVSVLWFGGDFPWNKPNGVAYTACTDGLRPVCFKLERIES